MPHEIQATTPAGISPIFTRRITGNEGDPILPADISSITYTIYELNPEDETTRNAIAGHSAVALSPVSAYVFDELQLDDLWRIKEGGEYRDERGYNFRHQPGNSPNPAFPNRGKVYELVYEFTPASGQKFHAPWRVLAV